jgi:hypothetical protein
VCFEGESRRAAKVRPSSRICESGKDRAPRYRRRYAFVWVGSVIRGGVRVAAGVRGSVLAIHVRHSTRRQGPNPFLGRVVDAC